MDTQRFNEYYRNMDLVNKIIIFRVSQKQRRRLERGIFMRKLFSKAVSLTPENVCEDVKVAKGEYITRTGGVWNWVMA
jgi:urease gamma subunit